MYSEAHYPLRSSEAEIAWTTISDRLARRRTGLPEISWQPGVALKNAVDDGLNSSVGYIGYVVRTAPCTHFLQVQLLKSEPKTLILSTKHHKIDAQ